MSKNKHKEHEHEEQEEKKQEEATPAEEQKNEEPAQKEECKPDPKDEEISKLKDQLLRNMAEYDNYRKRTAKERTELTPDITAIQRLPLRSAEPLCLR